jgi:hypothetical protein
MNDWVATGHHMSTTRQSISMTGVVRSFEFAVDCRVRPSLRRSRDSAAQQFVPIFKEPNWQPILKSGNVEIVAADVGHENAAGRGSRDRLDINFLVKRCGITGVAEALELYEEFFPDDPLPDRTLPLLDEAIAGFDP